MSSQRVLVGHIAKMNNVLDYEDNSDKLNDDNLYLNYDGTLVFHVIHDLETYEFTGILGSIDSKLLELCTKHDISIDENSVLPFIINWYDACDNPLSLFTEKDLKEGTL